MLNSNNWKSHKLLVLNASYSPPPSTLQQSHGSAFIDSFIRFQILPTSLELGWRIYHCAAFYLIPTEQFLCLTGRREESILGWREEMRGGSLTAVCVDIRVSIKCLENFWNFCFKKMTKNKNGTFWHKAIWCVCVWFGPTVGGDPDDGEEDLVLRCVLVEDADGRVGDDDSGVFLYVDAADGHHGPLVLHALLDTHRKMKRVIAACWQEARPQDSK